MSRIYPGRQPFHQPDQFLSGLRLVNRLITIVTTKQISQAHQARQKFAAMSLALSDSVSTLR